MHRLVDRSAGRWLKRIAAVVAAAATVLALTPQQGTAAEKLRIGAAPFYSSALAFLAEELGFWKEAGIDAEVIEFPGGSLVNEALLSGGIDMGMGVGAGPAVALTSQGARVLVVMSEAYTDTTSPPELLVVTGDSPITDVKQLDGKLVAIHAKGTLSHILLEALTERLGIKPTILEVPAPSQWVALKRGDVAAVMTETPFPEQMKAEGARYLFGIPHEDIVPYLAATVTLTTQKFADENPEVIKKAIGVALRTARWIMANPEESKKMIAARYNYKPEVTQLIDPASFKWSLNGTFPMPSIRWWGSQMKRLGLIQNEPDYEKYFVTRFVDDVVSEMGRVPDPDFDRINSIPIPTN